MLDLKFIRENAEDVKNNCADRGSTANVDELLRLDQERRSLDSSVQTMRAESKKLAGQPGAVDEARRLRSEITAAEENLRGVSAEVDALHRTIPNMTHPASPIGGEEASKEVEFGKAPIPSFSFKPKDHLKIAIKLGIVDMEAGTKVAGPGFYFLKGPGAYLELALQRFVIDKLVAKGFEFQITPDLAKNDILSGTGYVPRGSETNTYTVEDTDLSLIATAEIPLCGQYADTVVDVQQPIKLCGLSHCFRTERASGTATKGLYRVHQFSKVEMVILCQPEQSEEMHQMLLATEKEIFDDLGLPYRVLDIASGDLGASAYRKYDLEAWMPGRGDGGQYGEVTSASNCTDYQARRLNIKFVDDKQKRAYVHTLNGTGVAVSRALVALLENYQQEDGSVVFPSRPAQILGMDSIKLKR